MVKSLWSPTMIWSWILPYLVFPKKENNAILHIAGSDILTDFKDCSNKSHQSFKTLCYLPNCTLVISFWGTVQLSSLFLKHPTLFGPEGNALHQPHS